jgi:hypothetical protein
VTENRAQRRADLERAEAVAERPWDGEEEEGGAQDGPLGAVARGRSEAVKAFIDDMDRKARPLSTLLFET